MKNEQDVFEKIGDKTGRCSLKVKELKDASKIEVQKLENGIMSKVKLAWVDFSVKPKEVLVIFHLKKGFANPYFKLEKTDDGISIYKSDIEDNQELTTGIKVLTDWTYNNIDKVIG